MKRVRLQLLLLTLMIAGALLALSLGRIHISLQDWGRLLNGELLRESPQWVALMQIRLPRILASLFIGSGLAAAGTVFQSLFQNPLVSPHILGVSAGSGFGAALFILLGMPVLAVQSGAFVFGLLAVGLAYFLGRLNRRALLLMLVLSGVIVGSLFSALTSFLKYLADPLDRMPAIVFWLLGSLNNINWRDLLHVLPLLLLPMTVLWLFRWRLNLFSLGEEDARSLGENTEQVKIIIIACATLITSASVSLSGIIGWIGLVVPHMARLIVGADNRLALPVSMILGALFLCFVDTLSRSLSPMEIPIGILTAIIGAPVFALLLRRSFGRASS